jgi:hypothetical protein
LYFHLFLLVPLWQDKYFLSTHRIFREQMEPYHGFLCENSLSALDKPHPPVGVCPLAYAATSGAAERTAILSAKPHPVRAQGIRPIRHAKRVVGFQVARRAPGHGFTKFRAEGDTMGGLLVASKCASTAGGVAKNAPKQLNKC